MKIRFTWLLLLAVLVAIPLITIISRDNLDAAVQSGDLDRVKKLVYAGANVNRRDRNGFTALHIVASGYRPSGKWLGHKHLVKIKGTAQIAEFLIAHGADVNAKSEEGVTPLRQAVMFNNYEVTELLVSNGADVNAKDEYGATPLWWAIQGETTSTTPNKEMIELLLKNGADVHAKDNEGKTALDYAEELLDQEIIELLRKY